MGVEIMPKTYRLETLEIDQRYTLDELCQRIKLQSDFVIQCVEYGIAETESGEQQIEEWLFPVSCIDRLKKAARLQRDLGLDFNGLAVVIDLLDDIENLRSKVNALNRKLEQWEQDV
jgi:chaperone modulatory protein CbpM